MSNLGLLSSTEVTYPSLGHFDAWDNIWEQGQGCFLSCLYCHHPAKEIRAVSCSPPSFQYPGVGYLRKMLTAFPLPITDMDLSSEGTQISSFLCPRMKNWTRDTQRLKVPWVAEPQIP